MAEAMRHSLRRRRSFDLPPRPCDAPPTKISRTRRKPDNARFQQFTLKPCIPFGSAMLCLLLLSRANPFSNSISLAHAFSRQDIWLKGAQRTRSLGLCNLQDFGICRRQKHMSSYSQLPALSLSLRPSCLLKKSAHRSLRDLTACQSNGRRRRTLLYHASTSLGLSTTSNGNNDGKQKKKAPKTIASVAVKGTLATTQGSDPRIGDTETDQYFSWQECAARRDWDTIVQMIQHQQEEHRIGEIRGETDALGRNRTSLMMVWESWTSMVFGLQACLRLDNPWLAQQLIQSWIATKEDNCESRTVLNDKEEGGNEQSIAQDSAWFIFSMCKRAHRQKDWLDPALDLLQYHLRRQQQEEDAPTLPVQVYDAVFCCFLERRQWQDSVRLLQELELSLNEVAHSKGNNLKTLPAPSTYRMVIECCIIAGQTDRACQILSTAIERAERDETFVPTLYSFELVVGALCGNSMQNIIKGSAKGKKPYGHGQRRSQWRKALQLVAQLESLQLKQSTENTTRKIPKMTLTGICNPVLIAMCRAGEVAQAKNFLLHRMKKNGVRPNVLSYNSLISVCASSAGRWKEALELFDRCLRDPTLIDQPDIYTYTNAMRACAQGGKVRKAQSLLHAAHDKGLPVDAQAYTAVIHACAKAKLWKPALQLLDEMTRIHGIRPSEICFSAAITACGSADQWEKALQVMDQMKQQDILPSRISYNGVLAALSRASRQLVSGSAGGRAGSKRVSDPVIPSPTHDQPSTSELASRIWIQAKSVLNEMDTNGIVKDGFTFSAAISCCNIAIEAIDSIEKDDLGNIVEMDKMTRYTDDVLSLVLEMRSGSRRLIPTMVSYTNAIVNCGKAGRAEQALNLFQNLKEDYEFDGKRQFKAFSSENFRKPTSNEHRSAYNAMLLAVQKSQRADMVKEIWEEALGRRNNTAIAPDIVTVSNAIEALATSRLSRGEKNRHIDQVYSEAMQLKVPGLPCIHFPAPRDGESSATSSSWTIDVSNLSMPVAAAACRYAMGEIRDKIVQTNTGLHHLTILADSELRSHVQFVLAQDLQPPVTAFPMSNGLQVKQEMIKHWATLSSQQRN